MGYTHYMAYRPQTPEWEQIWPTLVSQTAEIIQFATDQGYTVADGMGEGEPELGPDRIALNGRGEQSCETFFLTGPQGAAAEIERAQTMYPERDHLSDFCKTNRRAYDAVVCAIILRAAQLCPTGFVFASDGEWNMEWEDGAHDPLSGRQIARAVFGTDEMPEPAHEHFFAGVSAGEIFARLDRTAAIERLPKVQTAPIADVIFDPDGGLGL